MLRSAYLLQFVSLIAVLFILSSCTKEEEIVIESIQPVSDSFAAHLSPNPFETGFYIHITDGSTGEYQLEILNLNGQIIYQKSGFIATPKDIWIDLGAFDKGIYLIRVYHGEFVKILKAAKV